MNATAANLLVFPHLSTAPGAVRTSGRALSLLLAIVVFAGCDRAPDPLRPAKSVTQHRVNADGRTLRVKIDTMRDRTWMLAVDHVDVDDRQTGRLIRRIELPAWSVADFVCEPDVAFDRSGTVFISHNLEPKLWQIDPDTFELKQHTIRLVNRDHLDIGFGRLMFAPDGTLFGVGSAGGSLWHIDLDSARAHEVNIDSPGLNECNSNNPLRSSERGK